MIDDTQLDNLSVDDKLRLVTNLWDQIARSEQSITFPEFILDDADRRIDEMVKDDATSLDEGEMWRRANDLR